MIKAKIISNPDILGGKPVISGTRIPVELIINFLGAGMSINDIITEYKELKRSEVRAAIEFAAKAVSISRSKSDIGQTPAVLHEINR